MKYDITVRATYIREMTIEADDEIEAKRIAIEMFNPDSDSVFSMDVFGLDPWRPIDDSEDRLYEQHRQQEIDDEA